MADDTGLGRRIFQARKQLEIRFGRAVSQAEIGKAVGVTGAAVGTWESGKKEPDLATIARLADALDVSPAWLAFGDEADTARISDPERPPQMPVRGKDEVFGADEKRSAG